MLRSTAILSSLIVLFLMLSGCGGGASAVPQQSSPSPSPKSPNISISPTSAVVGSADVTLTVTGFAFSNDSHNKSIVVFSVVGSETPLSTTFINTSQLTAVVPANLMVNPVTAAIFVETGDPMGSLPLANSDKVLFNVTGATGPTISSVSPTSALAGSPDLTITITGTGFVNVQGTHKSTWVVFISDGVPHNLITTFVSTTELTAVIPNALMVSPVSGAIQVQSGDRLSSFPPSISNSIDFDITTQ